MDLFVWLGNHLSPPPPGLPMREKHCPPAVLEQWDWLRLEMHFFAPSCLDGYDLATQGSRFPRRQPPQFLGRRLQRARLLHRYSAYAGADKDVDLQTTPLISPVPPPPGTLCLSTLSGTCTACIGIWWREYKHKRATVIYASLST